MIKDMTIKDLSKWHKVLFKEAIELKQCMSEAYDEGNLPLFMDFQEARHAILNDAFNTLIKMDDLAKRNKY